MNKLLAFILITTICWGCTETVTEIVEVETIVHDTLSAIVTIHDTLTIHPKISVSPRAVAFWEDDNLYAVLLGIGKNVSDETIDSVSIEFTIATDSFGNNILSENIGYFLPERPPFKYVPNNPYPYKIRHNLEPDSINYIYVGADTLGNINTASWFFRIIINNTLAKQAWQYGGELINE